MYTFGNEPIPHTNTESTIILNTLTKISLLVCPVEPANPRIVPRTADIVSNRIKKPFQPR
jgi:hypothetical protein